MCSVEGSRCSVEGCDKSHKARGLYAMHYQRWRRTGDPEKVRPAGRPRDERGLELFELSKGQWSPRTITRYKRVESLFSMLAVDESGEVDPQGFAYVSEHLRWATMTSYKYNVAGMERMAIAWLRAKAAGCTDEEWAELERSAHYPGKGRMDHLAPRVNVTRLKHLLQIKLEDMVNEGRLEIVHREGRMYFRKR